MSPRPLILVGGGEHACVVADAARLLGLEIRGYSDVKAGAAVERAFDLAWLGEDALASAAHPDASFIVAVGHQAVRTRVAMSLEAAGRSFASIIHPRATVAASAKIEDGAVLLAGAVVNPGATVGAHAIVNTSAVVEHDVVIQPLVHVSPAAAIVGGAGIGARAVIGLGARVRDHLVIGEDAVVGMGAAVIADVAPRTTVIGVPARPSREDHAAIR